MKSPTVSNKLTTNPYPLVFLVPSTNICTNLTTERRLTEEMTSNKQKNPRRAEKSKQGKKICPKSIADHVSALMGEIANEAGSLTAVFNWTLEIVIRDKKKQALPLHELKTPYLCKTCEGGHFIRFGRVTDTVPSRCHKCQLDDDSDLALKEKLHPYTEKE